MKWRRRRDSNPRYALRAYPFPSNCEEQIPRSGHRQFSVTLASLCNECCACCPCRRNHYLDLPFRGPLKSRRRIEWNQGRKTGVRMTTPIELGTLWGIWPKVKQGFGFARKRFERYAALEARVTALEAALARCPGEACPSCGARAFRLKSVSRRQSAVAQGQTEIWKCAECQNEYEYRYDEPGRRPPGAKR